ncbi:MAG: hypothetical protein ABIJ40_02350 [Bacteroidota bacterium]
MTKNALEASSPRQTVTLSCNVKAGTIDFRIESLNVILREVQLEVFQKSFSTKGSERGLGTYSVKLLTERYLRCRNRQI